ncbi:hypothetical protein MSAN_00153300 [Mycena sanguinolenta]|uniref:Uncharacterized protein n=1 Tax=Mycena sanguinolenta TaxID=230812 RepID=A0A8H6ZE28_9AGAR|nr:hypothetical protein MSAN_00153300 [Mycena sanguinolenta]
MALDLLGYGTAYRSHQSTSCPRTADLLAAIVRHLSRNPGPSTAYSQSFIAQATSTAAPLRPAPGQESLHAVCVAPRPSVQPPGTPPPLLFHTMLSRFPHPNPPRALLLSGGLAIAFNGSSSLLTTTLRLRRASSAALIRRLRRTSSQSPPHHLSSLGGFSTRAGQSYSQWRRSALASLVNGNPLSIFSLLVLALAMQNSAGSLLPSGCERFHGVDISRRERHVIFRGGHRGRASESRACLWVLRRRPGLL